MKGIMHMEITLSEIIKDLRALKWEETIYHLSNTYIPKMIEKVVYEKGITQSNINLLTQCVGLMEESIAYKDIILLCDILEYEFGPLVQSILNEKVN
jgi:hypothetical protein